MTDSIAIHSTITKQPKPTTFSDVEPKAASKDEVANHFKAGRLRKNAKKKIELLLSLATKIEYRSQSMGMDDCWDANEPQIVDVDFFWSWYEKEYSDLDIYVSMQDGQLTKVRFSDCPYHFSNDIYLTFEKLDNEAQEDTETDNVESVELATMEAYQDTDFVAEKVIESVDVIWSESGYFTDGETLTLAQYNDKSSLEALEIGRGNGYAKTKVTIHYQGGEVETRRHDIDADYPTLTVYLAALNIRVLDKPAKIRVTYSEVKAALAEGYLSPLNHDQKRPEPTPPTDEPKSRKVVSLGDYQERIESKKERLEARAEKAQAESNARFENAHHLGDALPFGQPILVGHHSERKHRRLIDNIDTNMRKSVEAQKKADHLEAKAESVGSAGIASDDPDAIQKLKEKLESLERCQEMMKAINKVIRSKHMTDADKVEYMQQTHHLEEKKAKELLEGDFCGRVGFPSYALQNNSATIRTTKQRIEELEKLHNEAPLEGQGEVDGTNWTLFEEDGRIKFAFDGIPSEAVRSLLKSNGFKWSRYAKAWVRKMTANAVRVSQWIVDDLTKMS
ncbi:DUF3560 domain-containing protein [Vibrio parahaemolyticus]|nr:DUF3560 domain-containing protein [Vibrio parahaemolyticus]